MESNSTPSIGTGDTSVENISVQIQWSTKLPIVLAILLVLAISTRFLSGRAAISEKVADGSSTVPMMPYWLPVIGHIPNLALMPDNMFNWARKVYHQGIFSLNLGGTTHNFIFKPSLGATLLNQKTEIADSEHVSKHLTMTNFGFPRSESDKYDAAIKELVGCYKDLLSDPGLGQLINGTVDTLNANIGNLVSFGESVVDQAIWERTSNAVLITTPSGEQVMEASLL